MSFHRAHITKTSFSYFIKSIDSACSLREAGTQLNISQEVIDDAVKTDIIYSVASKRLPAEGCRPCKNGDIQMLMLF